MMHTVLLIFGGMLAGAAVFTGFLWLVYYGTCILSEWVAASGWGWLIIPNLLVGPFAGAGLGFVAGLIVCGFTSFSHVAAFFIGLALLSTIVYWGVKELPGERPGVYTIRQGVPVVLSVGVEVVSELLFIIPFPCLVAIGLLIWGIMGR